ncbi:M23 family peptidase [Paludibacter sp. 221]|uniref:M23 family metallopeptidase n=1 Tax=Paludibacter sp. 221 TaxID=2302939 RepID=UPI0013D40B05|nr:M23 family metallopeptidase [Paludibacter sp. 221]NDV47755.1 M23 family peptidase [Paludibacter sp. 221]
MGKKKKFRFNPETLNYEQIEHTLSYKIKRFFVYILTGVFSGILFFFAFNYIIESPREKKLANENKTLLAQYKVLDKQLDEYQTILSDIQQRDDNLYRVIFQADPIPLSVRRSITPNNEYYDELLKKTNAQIIVSTTQKLNEIRKQLYTQSQSFDEVLELAKENEQRLAHIPAIQPVLNKDLKRVASGYGWRIDPVYGTRRHHDGMDFSAPIGTEIFATGNGTVLKTGWRQGYGNTVEIDHGFGYTTRYAHMSKINVKAGQKVKRADVIGLVGNTGKSTGPHLHYEVRYKNIIQNPQNFYFLDLSPEEYDLMVQLSNNAGQMFD